MCFARAGDAVGVRAGGWSGERRAQRFVVTGGQEGEVRVWELRSRELVSHLKEHSMRVTQLVCALARPACV